jgi:glycosyltransferase involved in cell wall biosynthesis
MACWRPVIAYGKWWALETVVDRVTWIFFEEQTIYSLNKAIEKFENTKFDYAKIRERSLSFSKEKFREEIEEFVKSKI